MNNVYDARMDSNGTWIVWDISAGLVYTYKNGRLDTYDAREHGVFISVCA